MIKKYEIIETVITDLYPNSELDNLLDNFQQYGITNGQIILPEVIK